MTMKKPKEDGQSSRERLAPQAVRLRQVSKVYAGREGQVAALQEFSCDIAEGEFAVILGPSGCGKSTVVRIIAGLEQASSGTVSVNGAPVARPGKSCSMVFQSYTSFPWLTVLENIAFGLEYTFPGTKRERVERARELARMVELDRFQNSYIRELSGGMRQRVAIASALGTNAPILLMDEPFGALDSQTRMLMQEHLLKLTQESAQTVVFVTHDIEEALLLGDRIYVCTARPGSVLAELDVPFPYPRDSSTRNAKKFGDLKYEIFHLLRNHIQDQPRRNR
jgi:ABC-type nitrate/sulfonate/bicarbonate transport system ATPase subunit